MREVEKLAHCYSGKKVNVHVLVQYYLFEQPCPQEVQMSKCCLPVASLAMTMA